MDIQNLQDKVAVGRDEVAYRTLFLHFYCGLLRFSTTYVGQKEIAEEIVSDVMLKIWTMGCSLNKVKNLGVYLFTSTKNSSINFLVSNKKYSTWDIDQIGPEVAVEFSTPIAQLLNTELCEQIDKSINSLPPKCRLAFVLNREDGLSYKEISEIMGISLNTVDRHLQIAQQKLGSALKNYLYQ